MPTTARGTGTDRTDRAGGAKPMARADALVDYQRMRDFSRTPEPSGRDDERQESWLLMKEADAYARSADEFKVVEAQPDSVLSHAPATPAPAAASAETPARAPPKSRVPDRLAPELASLVDAPPAGQ